MANKTCPLCKKPLSLQQININLAVFICEDLKCKYPVGFDCIVVERKLEDINKTMEDLNVKENLDDWVEEMATTSEKTQQIPSVSEDDLNSIDWIDNLVEEEVNKARSCETSNTLPMENNSTVEMDFDDILNFMYSG